jgi:ATP-binding protein involved in chromosome partitioning
VLAQKRRPDHRSRSTKTMRIAIPVADGRLCMHFGHCEQFAFVDTDTATRQVLETRYVTPPPHVPGLLPEWIQAQGAGIVVAGGMGARAQNLFAERGVAVVTGAPAEAPEVLARAYLDGTLVTGENACDH